MMYLAELKLSLQYSAATINAIDFQSEDPEIAASAGSRLSMSMYVLEKGISQAPGIRQSVEILKHRLRRPLSTARSTSSSLSQTTILDGEITRKSTDFANRSAKMSYSSRFGNPSTEAEAPTKKSLKDPPSEISMSGLPCSNIEDPSVAAPPSYSVTPSSTLGTPIGYNAQKQRWPNGLPSVSTGQDTRQYQNPDIDGWSTLYSLLTADDALYSTVEAMGQVGMQNWDISQGAQLGNGHLGGLGQMDLIQGAMVVPSAIDSGHTQSGWPGYFDEWEF